MSKDSAPVSTIELQNNKRPLQLRKYYETTRQFVIENYLPLVFGVALTWALAWPYPGRKVVEVKGPRGIRLIQEINMIIVFFLSGLALKTDDISKALKHSRGIGYGAVANLLLTPALGFVYRVIPLTPREFSIGLAIFCVVPTTLGIGVALVRSCKGNEGLALLLTVGCNLAGVVTMPLLLKLILLDVKGVNLDVDILNLFVRLVVTVLVPSVIGKTLRDSVPVIAKFATKYKVELGMFNTTNLAIIVWQNLSGARDVLFKQAAGDIVAIIVLSASQHITYLICNGLILWYVLPMPPPEAVAVWIMSSQKSAPVHVTVVSFMAKTTASLGLMVIPAVVGQLFQIFVGSLLARHIAPKMEAWRKAQASLAAPPATAAASGVKPGDEVQPGAEPALPATEASDRVVLDVEGKHTALSTGGRSESNGKGPAPGQAGQQQI